MLGRFGYAGPLYIEVLLDSIRDVPWIHFPDGLYAAPGPYSELDNTVTLSLEAGSDDLKDDNDELVKHLLEYILFAINRPQVMTSQGKLSAWTVTGQEDTDHAFEYCVPPVKSASDKAPDPSAVFVAAPPAV
jgi:hypothetical protein